MNYIEAMKCELKLQFRYRGEVFTNIISSIFPLVIYVFLWLTVYSRGGRMGTYSMKEIFTYYFWSTFFYGVMPLYAYVDITFHIKDGTLIYFLVKPMGYLTYMALVSSAGNLFWGLLHLFIFIPAWIILGNFLISPDLLHIIYGFLLWLYGFILSLLMGILFNLMAFYFKETYGFISLYSWFMGILGGSFIPLDLLPPVFKALPFKFIVFVPASVLSMRSNCSYITFLEETVWIVLLIILIRVVWMKGIKRFEAGGG